MKRFFALILVLAMAMTTWGTGVDAASRSSSLNGRLGGDQKSFEAQYGANSGQNESLHGLDYSLSGYGATSVLYRSDVAVSITLVADRIAHQPLGDADLADWDVAGADAAAAAFLPDDIHTDGKRLDTGDGRHEVACTSKTLAKYFDKSAWRKLKLGGAPGDCHYLISPDTDGNAYQIEVALGRAGSLDRPQPSPTATPKPTVEDIKASYPPLADVRELAIRPGGMMGDKLVFSGSILSIHVAPSGYVEVLGDSHPVEYAAQIQVTVAAPDGSTEVVMIGFSGDTTGMFEGSWVTVYGKVVDTATGTNLFGGTISQPLLSAQFVDLG